MRTIIAYFVEGIKLLYKAEDVENEHIIIWSGDVEEYLELDSILEKIEL